MDCLDGMKLIPDKSINCIITSPPYNVGLDYDNYDDNKSYDEYLDWIIYKSIKIIKIY